MSFVMVGVVIYALGVVCCWRTMIEMEQGER